MGTFAPTLVYKNDYPRTQKIRWNWVFWNFAQVIGVTFYLYFILERFCVPVFRQIGREPMSAKALILSIFGCMLPGTLVLLLGFYAILHSWLNAFAEMLRFGDRMFYQDWWNASSYATYYRTWNIVVHDWLYTYIYREVHELCGRRNRYIPLFAVFAVSSLVHEYIITFTFRCFYPILLFMFGGFGMVFTFVTNIERRLGNIFMWLTLIMGTGLFMALYHGVVRQNQLHVFHRWNLRHGSTSLLDLHQSQWRINCTPLETNAKSEWFRNITSSQLGCSCFIFHVYHRSFI